MVKFNWKKKAAKALVFAMVMGTVGVHGVSLKSPVAVMAEGNDEETTAATPTIKIDYSRYTATISTSADSYVFLEVLKENKADSKVTATYCYKVKDGKVVVDLSFLKASKEQYIRAYGNVKMEASRSDITVIAKQPAKPTIKYVPGKYTNGGDTLDLNESFSVGAKISEYEYKSLYSSEWLPFIGTGEGAASFDIDTASVAGTTLIVRQKAVDDEAPAGVEVKVKIAANPKAPKVAIDYVKGTVKLPKDSQYALLKDGALGTWEGNSAAKAWTLDELRKKLGVGSTATEGTEQQAAADDSFTIAVRTKAGKKAASALTFVTVDATPTLTKDDTNNTLTVGSSTTKLTYKNTTKGMELKAENGAFEYYDTAKSAWKTIAAGKSVEVKLENGAELKVRAAGVKPSKTVAVGSFASAEETLKCQIVPAKITLTAGTTELKMGGTITTKVEAVAVDGNKKTIDTSKYEEEENKKIAFKSSSDSVATIDENGNVEAKGAGKVTITATLNGVTEKLEITVAAADTTENE